MERVVRNGFEDKSLYNDELMKLNDLELQEFDDLKKIIGQTKAMPKTNQVDINNQGLTDEQYEELEDLEKKSKKRGKDKQPLTEEEKKRLEETEKEKEQPRGRYFYSSGYLHPYAIAYLRCRVER